eukprot:6487301-Pyramimonas_sp.AAC.1
MASVSLDSMLTAVRQRAAFINAQVAAGVPGPALLDTQTRSLANYFRSVRSMTHDAATALTQELNRGPWTATQVASLAQVLGDSIITPGTQSGPRGQQKNPTLQNYFTEADWVQFSDRGTSIVAKIKIMANRYYCIGASCPGEKMLVRGINILTEVGLCEEEKSSIDASIFKRWCHELQSEIKTFDRIRPKFPGTHIILYPPGPDGLDAAAWAFAYEDGQP